MSIYATPISHLKTSDLAELLQEQAVENTRLEFKSEVPNKDETLKKLTSFANTFGGYVVVGAAAHSKDGRIENLRGVDEVSGYKQKIVDWCYKECSPPVTVDVSGPIPTPSNGKVCYVISVEESEVAPHFLNGRKGVWIRTNEFSGRFDAALANENELQHLLHRRRLVWTVAAASSNGQERDSEFIFQQ
jgi:predicted HTH transcriptional regulator